VSGYPQAGTLFSPAVSHRKRVGLIFRRQVHQDQPRGDEEAVAHLCANDSDALAILFARYSKLVFGIALRILRDYGEAEDVVQDTFYSVFQKANLFDPSKGSAKTWIVEIALHRAMDRKSYLNRRCFYLGTKTEPLDDALLGGTDLDREVGASLNRAWLEKAFEELPQVQRRTLDLFYFEGMNLREISETLNETLGNVRHHFYRGLERLRNSAFVQNLREK
jgi:RNA polymerase sigma-70 factor (ECF subfamily)